jgi:hypothetical protein
MTNFKVLFLAVLCGFFSPITQAEEPQDKTLQKATEVINLLARTYHSHYTFDGATGQPQRDLVNEFSLKLLSHESSVEL